MIVAIHQPNFLPWLGYIGKIMAADKFVILDNSQFVKGDWHNRNKIRTPEGTEWITVPVEHHVGQSILDTPVNNRQPWQRKHLKTIKQNYSKAPFFKELFSVFEEIYSEPREKIVDLNIELIMFLMDVLNINTPVFRSSELNIDSDNATDRLVKICKILDGTEYLSGAHGRDYMELEKFFELNMNVYFQSFQHPVYSQLYPGFEPYVSSIDALFCIGPEDTFNLIKKGNIIDGL